MGERVVLKELGQLPMPPAEGLVLEVSDNKRYMFVLDPHTAVAQVEVFIDALRKIGIRNAIVVATDLKVYELAPEEPCSQNEKST